MAAERPELTELRHLRGEVSDHDRLVTPNDKPSPKLMLCGLAARRQKISRVIVVKIMPRWLVVATIAGCIFAVLVHYEAKPVMAKPSENRFNTMITGLSIALGLSMTASLDGMVGDLRWRILSRRSRSSHKVQHILQADSLIHLLRLARRSRRLTIHLAVLSWILLFLGSQIAVATLGLCYSTSTAERAALLVPGDIAIADLSTIQTNNTVSSGSSSALGAQQYTANSFGVISLAYKTGDLEDTPSVGRTYSASDPLLFIGNDLARYVFRETSVATMNADGIDDLSITSPRSITASTSCKAWRVTAGGNGTTTQITVDFGPSSFGNTTVELPVVGGTEQTTYMINTRATCGEGCSTISAFEASANAPWYYRCNVTVSLVLNATLPSHEASLDVRALAAGSIALQGYDVSSLVVDSINQFQSYPAESIYGSASGGDVRNLASVLNRFSIGAIAAIAESNDQIVISPAIAPERGEKLEIKQPRAIYFILFGVPGILLVMEITIAVWAHKIVVVPEGDPVAQAQVLRSMMMDSSANGVSGKTAPFDTEGGLDKGPLLAEPLWIYRATPIGNSGMFDLHMEKSYPVGG